MAVQRIFLACILWLGIHCTLEAMDFDLNTIEQLSQNNKLKKVTRDIQHGKYTLANNWTLINSLNKQKIAGTLSGNKTEITACIIIYILFVWHLATLNPDWSLYSLLPVPLPFMAFLYYIIASRDHE